MFELSFRYAKSGRANLGIYLHGWDGRRYVEDRAGRDPRIIECTTLTMALMVQQVVVTDLLADARATGRGLAARYLWSFPTSQVGFRPVDTPSVPRELSAGWTQLVEKLADAAQETTEPTTVTLSVEAERLFTDWRRSHEPRLLEGVGDLSGIGEWGSKLPGQVGRLALILHVAKAKALTGVVEAETMSAALELAGYFASHALRTFGAARLDEVSNDAHRVLGWLRRHPDRPKVIATREVHRGLHLPQSEMARAALEVLADYGWVEILPESPTGGRPSQRWGVSPRVYEPRERVTEATKPSGLAPSVPSVTDFQEADPQPSVPVTPIPGLDSAHVQAEGQDPDGDWTFG